MPIEAQQTVAEKLSSYWAANGLDLSPISARSWSCGIGPISFRLPNFSWRRRAILFHDLHHVLAGYPCTMRGEFQMATWEFAAGRFRHPASTLFCLPLVAAGLVWSPRAIWAAFCSGRKTISLYGAGPTNAILRQPFATLQLERRSGEDADSRIRDVVSFIGLISASALLICVPIACVFAIATLLV